MYFFSSKLDHYNFARDLSDMSGRGKGDSSSDKGGKSGKSDKDGEACNGK